MTGTDTTDDESSDWARVRPTRLEAVALAVASGICWLSSA